MRGGNLRRFAYAQSEPYSIGPGGWTVDVRDEWELNMDAWGPLAASMPLSSTRSGKY
ncbi:MAG: hypothetical protein QOH96_3435 [Blastocatellia bacterium]|nr:hypothetical protein [Blastocatellia bacterium]